MKVEIWLEKLNQGITHDAESVYQKGDFLCVKRKDGKVYKYPISHIFCIKESEFKLSH